MATPVNPANESIDDWGVCAPGTLSGLGQRMRASESRQLTSRLAARAASATAAMAAVVAIAMVTLQPAETPAAATRISCRQCVDLMPAFHQKLVHDEEGAPPIKEVEAASMKRHLDKCGGCRRYFEKKYPGCFKKPE